jgi:predicted AAA+ superfamily ATPase
MPVFQRENYVPILEKLYKGKIIIIYGPRQVGKTTLCNEILKKFPDGKIMTCDDPNIAKSLEPRSIEELRKLFGAEKLIIIDEAQRVENIGLTLKIIADNKSGIQVIATGSSSFDLANKVNEPLTGRNWKFYLFPLSIKELSLVYSEKLKDKLSEMLVFGSYPEVVSAIQDKKEILKTLSSDYLYKDLLSYEGIRKPKIIFDLLRLLALQIGNEVSYNEIARSLSINRDTVRSYIGILEQAFIIFTIPPLHKNKRKEISRLNKIYFYDNGIRNALVDNFEPLEKRTDTGMLFENFFVSEKIKQHYYNNSESKVYFWRTKQGQEIDFVEEYRGGEQYKIFECKWKDQTQKIPPMWQKGYNNFEAKLIHKDNVLDYFLGNEINKS